jgi:hypothetical protein
MVCATAYDEDRNQRRNKVNTKRVRDAVFFVVLTMKGKRN